MNFGYHYNSRVTLESGQSIKIGTFVNKKMNLPILIYNKKTKKIESKIVNNWIRKEPADCFYHIITKYPHGNGRGSIIIPPESEILTTTGIKHFKDITLDDKLLIKSKHYLNQDLLELATGMFLGDSCLRSYNDITCQIRTLHGINQNDYCKWKMNLFPKEYIEHHNYDQKGQFYYSTKFSSELMNLKKFKSTSSIIGLSDELLKLTTIKAIAIWFLDDGHFSIKHGKDGWGNSTIYANKLTQEDKEIINNHFQFLGLPKSTILKKGFLFCGESNHYFQKLIAPYIPKCMEYKLHPKLQGIKKINFNFQDLKSRDVLIEVPIIDIYKKPHIKGYNQFNLELENGNDFFIDNILVKGYKDN